MPEDHVPEINFMMAAEKAIKDLQDTAEMQGKLLVTAQKEARRSRTYVYILGLVSALLTALIIIVSVQYFHVKDVTNKVQQGAVSQCVNGNSIRHTEVAVWDDFVGLLLQDNKDPKAQAIGRQFETFIASKFAPRDCTSLFGTQSASNVSPDSNAG